MLPPLLRHHVDIAAERAAELRLAAGGDHLKFVDHVEADRTRRLPPRHRHYCDRPSMMKLLEKFRWLPTEIPWPGTADVSAKS